jgi:hypothetical protein
MKASFDQQQQMQQMQQLQMMEMVKLLKKWILSNSLHNCCWS